GIGQFVGHFRFRLSSIGLRRNTCLAPRPCCRRPPRPRGDTRTATFWATLTGYSRLPWQRRERAMLFQSRAFIFVFLRVCLGGFFLVARLAGRVWALRWLVAANLLFYGWWDSRFVPLLIGSVLLNHLMARGISHLCRAGQRGFARRLLAAGIVLD